MGITTSYQAEICGALRAIEIAHGNNLSNRCLETNSSLVAQAFKSQNQIPWQIRNIWNINTFLIISKILLKNSAGFCSFPSEMIILPLRELTHATCCYMPRQSLISSFPIKSLSNLSNYPNLKFLQLQIKQHSNNKNK